MNLFGYRVTLRRPWQVRRRSTIKATPWAAGIAWGELRIPNLETEEERSRSWEVRLKQNQDNIDPAVGPQQGDTDNTRDLRALVDSWGTQIEGSKFELDEPEQEPREVEEPHD